MKHVFLWYKCFLLSVSRPKRYRSGNYPKDSPKNKKVHFIFATRSAYLVKKMLTKVTSGVLGLVMLAAEVGFQTFCISTQTVYTTRRTQACWNWTGHITWVNVPTLSQGINFQWFTQRFGQSFILFCVWHFSAIQYAKWRKWGLGFRAILWLFYFS